MAFDARLGWGFYVSFILRVVSHGCFISL
jgi:hypothetical protein